jgi:hypothetical protein
VDHKTHVRPLRLWISFAASDLAGQAFGQPSRSPTSSPRPIGYSLEPSHAFTAAFGAPPGFARQLAGTLPVPEGGVGCLAFSPDGKTLAARYTADHDRGGVVLWVTPACGCGT